MNMLVIQTMMFKAKGNNCFKILESDNRFNGATNAISPMNDLTAKYILKSFQYRVEKYFLNPQKSPV